jgi:hypothetical protein
MERSFAGAGFEELRRARESPHHSIGTCCVIGDRKVQLGLRKAVKLMYFIARGVKLNPVFLA